MCSEDDESSMCSSDAESSYGKENRLYNKRAKLKVNNITTVQRPVRCQRGQVVKQCSVTPEVKLRDQASINRKHALAKRLHVESLEKQVTTLRTEMARKEEEFNIAMDIKEEELRQLKEQLVTQRMSTAFEESTLKGSKYEWALALKSKGMPCIKKEKDPASMLSMVSAAICAVMAVIMSKTRNVTRLKVVCKVLFEMFLFCYDETRFVFHQMARKFVREEIYKPWKILKAMDMSPKGSLNYRGIETLRHVECLQKYERGPMSCFLVPLWIPKNCRR